MKNYILVLLALLLAINCFAQEKAIEFLVRADDIGSSHAANLACIKAYQQGIARSVEIMVPCPWFPEAVKMLKENPGYDVGVHLVLTSEWMNIKWRPLTKSPGLTDKYGFFYPFLWTNKNYGPGNALLESNWTVDQVEQEFRAQIEMALEALPNISHISTHMGCSDISDEVREMTQKLADEYGLLLNTSEYNLQSLPGYDVTRNTPFIDKVQAFVSMLSNMTPGRYLFIEHPGMDVQEMQAIGHIGYMGVARDRQNVTDLMTHPQVLDAIVKNNIKLISYGDLKNSN